MEPNATIQSDDPIGDVLREFYQKFGLNKEGPGQHFNVTKISEIAPGHLDEDIEAIKDVCANNIVLKKFKRCQSLVDEIADNLSSNTQLLQEIDEIFQEAEIDFNHITNGIFWYTLAAGLDPNSPTLEDSVKLPSGLDSIQEKLIRKQGSLVFRLYIALVYMREGAITELLRLANAHRKPLLIKYDKLFKCDYVRHIRNAISHGNINGTIAGICFKDNGTSFIASPDFLNHLCTWFYLAQHSYMSVLKRRILDCSN